MKIWLAGSWYTLPDYVLIVHLSDQDKKNIKNMHPDCDLYCAYDEKIFTTEEIKEILTRLKKELRRMKK